MTAIKGEASSSGHITLLFSVQDSSNELLEQGSRGVGLCIDPNEPACTVTVEGKHRDVVGNTEGHQEILPLHQTVIEELANYCPEIDNYVKIDQKLEIGKIYDVKIKKAYEYDVLGSVLNG